MNIKQILSTFALFATVAVGSTLPTTSDASPSDDRAVWSFGGLYVDGYSLKATGEVSVTFKDKKGTRFKSWRDKNGKDQCGNRDNLLIHPQTPSREDLKKTIIAAGLAQKPLHVWFEPIGGQCYIKWLGVKM